MIEHLPPGSPWAREVRGQFDETHLLLREVESRMRDLLVVNQAMLAALKVGLRLKGSDRLPTPQYIPVPGPVWEDTDADEVVRRAPEAAELTARFARNRQAHRALRIFSVTDMEGRTAGE